MHRTISNLPKALTLALQTAGLPPKNAERVVELLGDDGRRDGLFTELSDNPNALAELRHTNLYALADRLNVTVYVAEVLRAHFMHAAGATR